MRSAWEDPPRVIGHRGSPREAPENTLASFLAAVASGARAVELDARLTADGVVVVHHDRALGRVMPGEACIDEVEADALPRALPRLADVLGRVPAGILLDVELKPDGLTATELPAAAARVVAAADAQARVAFTSFDPAMATAAGVESGCHAGLVAPFVVEPDDLVDSPELRIVALGREAAHPDVVQALRDAGRAVLAWTVDDPEEAAALVARGVQGVVTDRPGPVGARLRADAAARPPP